MLVSQDCVCVCVGGGSHEQCGAAKQLLEAVGGSHVQWEAAKPLLEHKSEQFFPSRKQVLWQLKQEAFKNTSSSRIYKSSSARPSDGSFWCRKG